MPFLGTRYVGTFREFDVNRAITMLIHGSELVAVAQGLVEYRDLQWIFSAGLYDIISQKSEHVTPRGMSRASRELLGPSA